MSKIIALYDACVLYPAPLRDLLMQLAVTDLFHAKWTNQIHDEWIRNLLKNRPDLTRDKLIKIRNLMNENVRDCLVEKFENISTTLKLPDKDDHHVLAAAIKCSASTIVTFNLKDFPKNILQKYDIEPQHPDDFIIALFESRPAIICACAKTCRLRLKKPTFDVERYLAVLEKQSLPKLVSRLREYAEII